MYDRVPPDEAARALTEIGRRQEQVINLSIIPTWYWWAVAGLMVVLSAAADSHRPLAVGIGATVFAVGMLVATGRVVLAGARRAPIRNEMLGSAGVLAILALVAAVLAVALPTAFTLRAAGAHYAATGGVLFGGAVLVVGGPMLMRFLHRRMLDNRAGSRR